MTESERAWDVANILGWPKPCARRVVTVPPAPRRVQMITYPFPLRSGFLVPITLPIDLTAREAGRIARILEVLPL